jgi:hypothetical protein
VDDVADPSESVADGEGRVERVQCDAVVVGDGGDRMDVGTEQGVLQRGHARGQWEAVHEVGKVLDGLPKNLS